ncbi:acetyl-L-homoserine sulfhydrolase [Candidatus Marinamargulisbacteria bacterium SCGC AG-343-D04]|nr:acetyl-L-homoserine sulfhydrolase [Candidatus Marinamargulisbacteria bacterium SCGC AG-343-D04]
MADWNFDTQAIHGGFGPDEQTGATKVPIYQSAGFAHETAQELEDTFQGKQFGYYYSRVSNPTINAIESRINAMERGRGAVLFSSGMAAISNTILSLAKAGDNIVVGKSLFGSTYYLFKGLISDCGIEVRFVDPTDTSEFESKIDDSTQLIFVESLGNPKLDVPDFKALSKIAKAQCIPLIVDSTFTTPFMLQAKEWGIDVVLYATTKYICGGGSTIGGAVVDTGNFKWKDSRSKQVKDMAMFGNLSFLSSLKKVRSNAGAIQAPFNAFITGLGFETLALRMEKHSTNALALAQALEKHKAVDSVNYPGLESHNEHSLAKEQFNGCFGGMLTVRLGSKENAFACIDAFKMIRNLVNLGDSKTLAVYPATTIYRHLSDQEREEAGVYSDLIRVSVGLENSQDIINDFIQACDAI